MRPSRICFLTLCLLVCGLAIVGVAAADVTEEEPTTEETIGYVDGYWYDDELPVDDRDGAAVTEDELEAVVARSMARVEVIRELSFMEDVDVEVITREEFEAEIDEILLDVDPAQERHMNVFYEATYMVDGDTDAIDEIAALLGGAVAGYYDPETEQIVLVSDSPEEPEVDEVTLGHELLHALQDQYWDLESIERSTFDQSTAADGLIEGDAVVVDTEYQERCQLEWDCLVPSPGQGGIPDVHDGLLLQFVHPYLDGPAYVETILAEDGWEGINEVYEAVPTRTAEIIHPGTDREFRAVTIEDRSTDEWEPLPSDAGNPWNSLGELGLVTVFMYQTLEAGEAVGLETDEIGGFAGIDYAHEVTDGWAGDQFVAYGTEEETGYVWEIAWTDEEEAEVFLDGYMEVLGVVGATPVEDRVNTYELDEPFGGALYVGEYDDTVRLVNAPSVDDLQDVHEGAAPSGDESREIPGYEDDDDADDENLIDTIPASGVVVVGVVVAVTAFLVARSRAD